MKNTIAPRWAIAAFPLSVLVFSPLHAEELPDPTRPPAGIIVPAFRSGAALGATSYHPSGLRLIIISKTRRAAIIDGKTVELGENYGNAKLVEVNEDSVVLQRAQSRQVLSLFPGVKITHKDAPAPEPKITGSTDNELQVEQPSSANNAKLQINEAEPAATKEEK